MPRPALRPHPAGTEFVDRDAPPDWGAVFGADGPLELEIGAGAGGFCLEYARRFPHVRYVAFEWRKKYAREIAHRAGEKGLSNLKVIEADAREEIPRLFRPGSLVRFICNFLTPGGSART